MVRQVSTIKLDRKAQLFRQLRGQYFLTCFEMFQSGPMADLVFEYMDLSLLQILGAPLFPAEKHIVAIAAQVWQNSSRLNPLPTNLPSWWKALNSSRSIKWFMGI